MAAGRRQRNVAATGTYEKIMEKLKFSLQTILKFSSHALNGNLCGKIEVGMERCASE